MAAVGASGLSLVLGVYNTKQIASLKETIASISGLDTTIVPPPEISQPATMTIQPVKFRSASSPEIQELQQRLTELESFSNSVSTSSASNSSTMSQSLGTLATKLNDLELFTNTASTRSTTNEGNIVMINDEIDRLKSFAAEELTSVRDRVGVAEESVSTNASNIGLLQTSVGDVETGVSSANSRIDAVVAMTTSLETSILTTQAAVTQNTGSITKNSNAVTDLVQGVDALGDNIALVNGNETETRNNLASLAASWNVLNEKAYVADGLLKAVNLSASNCNLGLSPHDGQKSALHLAGLGSANWSMYVSSPEGKGPDGKTPPAHGDVTKSAVRMRIKNDTAAGFIVENSDNQGVFSVSMAGNTRMGLGKIGDLNEAITAFSHHSRHNVNHFAFGQHRNGKTYVNSVSGSGIEFKNSNNLVAFMKNNTVYINISDGHRTTFNNGGSNSVYCGEDKATTFGAGKRDPVAHVNKHGLYARGLNVYDELVALEKRVSTIEGKYLDRTRTVKFYNGASKRYLKRGGNNNADVGGSTHDVNNHFHIHYD